MPAVLLFGSTIGPAHAFSPTYGLGAETQLHREVVTPSFFPILSGTLKADSANDSDVGETHEYKVDLTVRISPTHPKAFALTSPNLYYGEIDQSYASPLRFSFGRKLVGWSKLDSMWGLGEFEPLDSWDRLRYSTQGLTGIFAYTESDSVNVRFFASFIAIPEITPNVVVENHRFVLDHPQAISTTPQSYTLLDRPTPLGYELDIGNLSKIVFRPSVAFSIETSRKNKAPIDAKFSYGYLPLNYFPIALQATLAIPLDQIVVNLRPRLLHHHLYNVELSHRFENAWSTGIVGLINDPVSDLLPTDYTATPLTTSYTVSPWVQLERRWGNLQLSWLRTWKGLDADVGPYASPDQSIFSSRILYRNASQFKGRVLLHPTEPRSAYVEGRFLHEFAVNGNWLAADFVFFAERNLSFLVGGDIISAEKTVAPDRGAEFLADMRAIDRVRLGVQYVF